MTDITQADLNRLYDKLDPMAEDLAVVKDRMERLPVLPDRPCEQLSVHLDEHKAWKRPVIRAAVDIVKMAVVGAVCFVIGKK